MRSSLALFRLFPPPKMMLMLHAGLDISDDGIRLIRYEGFGSSRRLKEFDFLEFPDGLFVGGDIKDERAFVDALSGFASKHSLREVKVSVPEEKAYLFQTEVPTTDQRSIEQNIEFKLEENVPLSAPDAVFYFDLLPRSVTAGAICASVSVVPRTYIEKYTKLLVSAGLDPVSFETAPKAIARALIHEYSETTRLVIHFMRHKTGIYITSGNVVHFTFTAPWGADDHSVQDLRKSLAAEVGRIRSYWLSHGNGKMISEAMLVGKGADVLLPELENIGGDMPLSMILPNIWENSLDLGAQVPDLSRSDSMGYAVAAGLAFDMADK